MCVYINSPKFKILNLPLTFHLQYPPDSRDNDLYWLGRYALPSHDSMLGKKDTILLLCIFKIYLRFYFTFLLLFHYSCPIFPPLPTPCSLCSPCCPCPWVLPTSSFITSFPVFPYLPSPPSGGFYVF